MRFFHTNTGTAWWIEEGLEVGPYDDPELRPATERCTAVSRPPHLPTLYNNLKKIVQTDDTVMINIEFMHDTRIIPILAEGPPTERDAEELTSLNGNSIGWWDGDTLVVDTVGFTPRPGVSEGLHVIERFSRIDADSLLYGFTVDDPAYVRPYSGEYPWPRTDGTGSTNTPATRATIPSAASCAAPESWRRKRWRRRSEESWLRTAEVCPPS